MTRICCLSLAGLAAAGCVDVKGSLVVPAGTAADSAEQVMYGVRAPITQSGVRRGELVADSMYVFENQTRFDFFHGHVDFFMANGAPNGRMRGDRGRYSLQTEVLEGWGNVVVATTNGNSLSSPHIVYDQRQDRITSDTNFVFVHNGSTYTGSRGLETDSRMTRYNCFGVCTATGPVMIPK